MTQDVYCIDSSSLIKLVRDYPRRRFGTVWERLDQLVRTGRLIAPREVLKEALQGEDELAPWAKQHRRIFQPVNEEQAQVVSQILENHVALIDPLSDSPQADPFVIALAKTRNQAGLLPARHVVVSEEGKQHPHKIPKVCAELGIGCIRLLELFEAEGWSF